MQYNDGSPYMWVDEVEDLLNKLSIVIKEGLDNGKEFEKIEVINTLNAKEDSNKMLKFDVKFKTDGQQKS
jgi:hypothetical protein